MAVCWRSTRLVVAAHPPTLSSPSRCLGCPLSHGPTSLATTAQVVSPASSLNGPSSEGAAGWPWRASCGAARCLCKRQWSVIYVRLWPWQRKLWMAVLVPVPEPVLGVLPQALMATPLACWTRMWQYQQSRGRPRKTLRWYGVHFGDGGYVLMCLALTCDGAGPTDCLL